MPGLKVALLANLKKNAPTFPGMSDDHWDDLDSEATVDTLVNAIRAGGHECVFREGNAELYNQLAADRPDICFNICEGHFGDGREAQVPALLEMLRIPYTGSKVMTHALALDKPMTKRVLMWHDLPTPAFQTFETPDEPLDDDMIFPLFVKPAREGTGMGVSHKSIVRNEQELREQLTETITRYKQTALVERFIAGREATVGMVGNISGVVARRLPSRFYGSKERDYSPAGIAALKAGGLTFLPPLEINLKQYAETDGGVYSNRLKTDLADADYNLCPAPLEQKQVQELNWLAAAVFRVLGCYDVSRVDFRLNEAENYKPYILEINTLPGLSPVSDLVVEAKAMQMSHEELVNMILEAAIARYGLMSGRFVSTP